MPRLGFATAESYLARVQEALERASTNAKGEYDETLSVASEVYEDATTRLACLSTYSSQFHLGTIRKICAELACDDAQESYSEQHKANLHKGAISVCDQLLSEVKRFQTELAELEDNLSMAISEASSNRRKLNELPTSKSTTRVAKPEDMRFYKATSGESFEDANVRRRETLVQNVTNNLWSNRVYLNSTGREGFVGNFLKDCQLILKHHLYEPPNAAVEFKGAVQDTEYAAKIGLALDYSGAWVRTTRYSELDTFGATQAASHMSNVLLATTPPQLNDAQKIASIQQRVKEAETATNALKTVVTQRQRVVSGQFAPDVVLATTAVMGLPLSVFPEVAKYKETFDMMLSGRIPITDATGKKVSLTAFHIESDTDRYTPIVIPDPESGARMRDAATVFVQGVVIGLIVPYMTQGQASRVEFSMKIDTFGKAEFAHIGTRNQLLALLAERGNHFQGLSAGIQSETDQLHMAGEHMSNRLMAAYLANDLEPNGPMKNHPMMVRALATILQPFNSASQVPGSAPDPRAAQIRAIADNKADTLKKLPGGYYTLPRGQ
jgi:hypothetical protein